MILSAVPEPEILGIPAPPQLMSAISHTINNHLGAIFLNADRISASNPEFVDIAEEIVRSANDLRAIAAGFDLLLRGGTDPCPPLSAITAPAMRFLRLELASKGCAVNCDTEGCLQTRTSNPANVFLAIVLAGEAICEGDAREGASLDVTFQPREGVPSARFRSNAPWEMEGPAWTRLERFLVRRNWPMDMDGETLSLPLPTGEAR